MAGNDADCKKIEVTFRNATKVFDEPAAQVLIYHLEERDVVFSALAVLHLLLPF